MILTDGRPLNLAGFGDDEDGGFSLTDFFNTLTGAATATVQTIAAVQKITGSGGSTVAAVPVQVTPSAGQLAAQVAATQASQSSKNMLLIAGGVGVVGLILVAVLLGRK